MISKVLIIFIVLASMWGCDSRKPIANRNDNIDTVAPILTLKGKSNEVLKLGEKFIDKGYSATDNEDGNITSSVQREGFVDTSKVGSYKLTYSVEDSAGNSASVNRVVRVTTFAKVKLGALSNAKVEIFKLLQSKLEPLIVTKTNSADFTKLGEFDTYADMLDDNATYLYRVSGGEDYDKNNDGIKDENASKNSYTLNAIVTKKDIVTLNSKFSISPISELAYKMALDDIKYDYQNLASALDAIAKELIFNDISGDSKIDRLDTLVFDIRKNIKDSVMSIENEEKVVPTKGFARYIMKADSTTAYIADGDSGVSIFDLKSKKVTATIKTKDFARRVAVSSDGSLAFVADSKAGLTILDLTTKEIISNIPSYESNTTKDCDARDVVIDGDKAYVTLSSRGFMVVDISNPNAPKVLKVIDTPDIAYTIKLLNSSTALVADGKTGVLAIDLDTGKTIGKFNTYGVANSITISEAQDKVYIADGYKGMVVADISDLTNITYLSHVSTSDFASNIVLNSKETRAYVSDRKGNIQVVDISKEKPSIINHLTTPYRSYASILSENEKELYVATGNTGITILPTIKLQNPAKISKIFTAYKAYNLAKKENTLFVAQGYKGLKLVDISNPKYPKTKSYLDTKGFSADLAVDGNYTYLADGTKGVLKIDISNLSSPTLVDSYDTDGFTSSIKLIPNSNKIVISDGDKGVKLIDKDSLTLLQSLATNKKALDITVDKDGKKAYLALGVGGVWVIDLDSLTKIKEIDTKSYIKRVVLNKDETKAYLVGDDGVKILNLSTYSIEKTIPLDAFSSDIKIVNNLAYIANENGLSVIDLTTNIELIEVDTTDKAKDILIDKDIAYVSSSSSGVWVIDLDILAKLTK